MFAKLISIPTRAYILIGLSFCFSHLSLSASEKLSINTEKLKDLIQKQSNEAALSETKRKINELSDYSLLSDYDLKLTSEIGLENDKTESFQSIGYNQFNRSKYLFSFNKKMTTGTLLNLEFDHFTQNKSIYQNGFYDLQSQSVLFLNVWSIELNQQLLSNSFGESDKLKIESSDKLQEASRLQIKNENQNLYFQALKLFWNAYIAKENYKEALNAKERYSRLITTLKKKSGLGFTVPGELNLTLAEAESREQIILQTRYDLDKSMSDLKNILNFDNRVDFDIEIANHMSFNKEQLEQKLTKIEINDQFAIQAQKSLSLSKELELKQIKSKNQLDLSLVVKSAVTGLEESSSPALNETLSYRFPKNYVGLKLNYSFGSNYREEELLNKKYQLEIENIRYKKLFSELTAQKQLLTINLNQLFQRKESIEKQIELKEKALVEISRTYQQGRTDIRNLIDSINSFYQSKNNYSKTIGELNVLSAEISFLNNSLLN